MRHQTTCPYLGIWPRVCVRPLSLPDRPPASETGPKEGIEYLSTLVTVCRLKEPHLSCLLLYLCPLDPVNSCKERRKMPESGAEYSFDGSEYMKRLADRERPMPRDSPLLIQVLWFYFTPLFAYLVTLQVCTFIIIGLWTFSQLQTSIFVKFASGVNVMCGILIKIILSLLHSPCDLSPKQPENQGLKVE